MKNICKNRLNDLFILEIKFKCLVVVGGDNN